MASQYNITARGGYEALRPQPWPNETRRRRGSHSDQGTAYTILKWAFILAVSSSILAVISVSYTDIKKIKKAHPPHYLSEPPEAHTSDVIITWMEVFKRLTTETPGFTPPVAARAFGYMSLALNEAVQVGRESGGITMSGRITGFDLTTMYDKHSDYHWPSVVNAVFEKMASSFYFTTSDSPAFALIAKTSTEFNVIYSDVDAKARLTSREFAGDLADKVLAYAALDGGSGSQMNNFPLPFKSNATKNLMTGNYIIDGWQPTKPRYQDALQPFWGDNRPFLASSLDVDADIQSATVPMHVNSTAGSPFFEAAKFVYDTVNSQTPEQKIIAEFWSDDPMTSATPPGHSIAILNQLIREKNVNLAEAAEQFAMLGISVNDAFISCWKVKYDTDYPRPVTFINDNIDASWNATLETPPFPEYTSGHSVQTGALAAILTALYGDSTAFTDATHKDRTDIDGTPRTYASFHAMAEEAALSRLYGGIHFEEAIHLGLVQGRRIGSNVVALFEAK